MAEERPGDSDDLERPPSFFPYDESDPGPDHPADYGEPVEVQVNGVYAAQAGEQVQQFVLLNDEERRLPIVIGIYEATAITLALEGQQPDRPMTHDLIRNMLDRLEATLDRIVIDDLWGSTYYAKIYLRQGDKELEIDSRPSDAIALAIRFEAPIFVAEGILDQGSN
ncbi:MAG: bifunctional nuclease family protein [Fimbriimonadaceae bacterium]|nr:bifunctional nuclease family protein [Fimbriimonadaceae bacterium]QYK55135.1 MAG: bifunctional nuclease family protein [Fimbriimonadaceae bacterium]